MKYLIKVLTILVLFAFSIFAQTEINKSPDKVKLYFSGAELYYSELVNANGDMEITFTNLANNIDASSIRVSVDGNCKLISTENKLNFIKSGFKSAEQIELENEMEKTKTKIMEIEEGIRIVEADIKMNSSNFEKSLEIKGIKSYVKFAKTEMHNLLDEERKLKLSKEKLGKELLRIENQLNQISSGNKRTSEILVKLQTASEEEIRINLSYFTTNASWQPQYNLFVSDSDRAELEFSGMVSQSTGIDWENVALIFSGNRKIMNGILPVFNPTFVDFNDFSFNKVRGMVKTAERVMLADNADAGFKNIENKFSVEYISSSKVTIKNKSDNRKLQIANYLVDLDIKNYLWPQFGKDAFVISKLNSEQLNQLTPGKISIVYNNSISTESYFNPQTAKDMQILIGNDPRLTTVKTLVTDFKDENFIGTAVKRIMEYEITVKNQKNSEQEILLIDFIPISKDEKIQVELIDADGATLDEKTGKLLWNIKLNSNEKRKVKLKYSIEYPSDRNIQF